MFTVLWDNDGVLVDTEGLYFLATKTVLASVGVELTPEYFKDVSLRRGESTLRLAAEQGIADERIACLRAQRDRLYADSLGSRSCLIGGVREAILSLYGKVRMGVVTSTRREHFEIAHAASGVAQYMDFVIAREDCPHVKPHPEPYLTAMARHGLRPDECIVIEDSERGLTSALAAGLKCLVVLSQWTNDGDFRGARRVLESIREVPGAVMEWIDGEGLLPEVPPLR